MTMVDFPDKHKLGKFLVQTVSHRKPTSDDSPRACAMPACSQAHESQSMWAIQASWKVISATTQEAESVAQPYLFRISWWGMITEHMYFLFYCFHSPIDLCLSVNNFCMNTMNCVTIEQLRSEQDQNRSELDQNEIRTRSERDQD